MCFREKLESFTILCSAGEVLAEVMTEQAPEGGRRKSHKISGGPTGQAERRARAKTVGEHAQRLPISRARAAELQCNKQGNEQGLMRGSRPCAAFQLLKGLWPSPRVSQEPP